MVLNVLVTAGATREPIDAVRHISNFATGNLGIKIAKEAYNRGYEVHLLYGFGSATLPRHIYTRRFTSTQNLLEKVVDEIQIADIYISSAAVSDYAPIPVDEKISSDKDELVIRLAPTPKILKIAREIARPETKFVAFKLGYNLSEEELIRQAISGYGNYADLIVANDLRDITQKTHKAIILYKGEVISMPTTNKEIAIGIFDCLEKRVLS